MNKRIFIILFISTFGLSAKEKTYTSSTITRLCKESGYSVSECKKKAKQPPKTIYSFKTLVKNHSGSLDKSSFDHLLSKAQINPVDKNPY